MIKVYLNDSELIYDSRVDENRILALTVEQGLSEGGAAYITLPPGHPAYNSFVAYKTIVTIYKDDEFEIEPVFRGRALYPKDDFRLNRTITCEGEKCFLNDAVASPGVTVATPAYAFRYLIGNVYNNQVEEAKRFVIGDVDLYFEDLERFDFIVEQATSVANLVSNLVETYGGYVVINNGGLTTKTRYINWYKDIGYQNNQVIEFGENLLDFTRSDSYADLATAVMPFGKKDEVTGQYLNIARLTEDHSVIIKDDEAVALRGFICKPLHFDDITADTVLLAKAQEYLATSKLIVTSLELTAIDLSILDKTIDSFRVGDIIRVKSAPHGVNDDYLITKRSIDLLNPAKDRIVLGKSIASLSGTTAHTEKQLTESIKQVEQVVIANYTADVAAVIEETKALFTSLINQTSEEIRLEVAEEYSTQDALRQAVSTSLTQLSDSFEFLFNNLKAEVDSNDANARARLDTIQNYIKFENGNILLGETGNELTLKIENDRIAFIESGVEVAYFSDRKLYINDGEFLHSLALGNFAFMPRANGNLSFKKVK